MKRISACLLLFCVLFLHGCGNEIPEVPKNATATAEQGQSIRLSWSESEGDGFYRIYRLEGEGEGEGVSFKFVADTEDTEYTDASVVAGREYRYKITAVLGNTESEGALTEKVTVAKSGGTEQKKLTVPVITAVTKMDIYTNVIQFSSDNSGCSYEIFRCPAIDGTYVSIGKTDETVWYDESADGAEFYYKVTAQRGDEKTEASVPQKTGKNAKSVFRVPVIMYHEFVTYDDLDKGVAFDEYAIWQSEFEADLRWLSENGYTTITCRQLADYMEGRDENIPSKPILLTCDDGKYGVYVNAYPILKKYGMTMSLALIGYEIDSATDNEEAREKSAAPFCTWSEIAEMSESGAVEMISHTQSLHVFSHDNRSGANCAPNESYESFLPVAQADFAVFNTNLREHIGEVTEAMAYPYSKRSVTADRAWLKSGYKILLGGDDINERKTMMNYFVKGAGVNSKSAVMRRLPRMVNVPIKTYIDDSIAHDEG